MILYHYTTIAGLLGILKTKSLWASDCIYLNDGTEIKYAEDIFFSEIDKLRLPELSDGGYNIPYRGKHHWRAFVCCFCEEADLLSQWRAYTSDNGYALGFDFGEISTSVENDELGLQLMRVEYGIENPRQYFASALQRAPTPSAHPGMAAYNDCMNILPLLAKVKDQAFSEEREWRLMQPVEGLFGPETGFQIRFRPSNMGPVPYIEIPFKPEWLKEIVIGPGPYSDVRRNGVRDLANSVGLYDCTVRRSSAPLRG